MDFVKRFIEKCDTEHTKAQAAHGRTRLHLSKT